MNPFFVAPTDQPFEAACEALARAVAAHGFGVLAVHDLGATLRDKGINFAEDCCVFEVCNPRQAAELLEIDMSLNMALPCRISVYTEAGQTRIGMIRPGEMLKALSQDPALIQLAQQVESSTTAMIVEAASATSAGLASPARHVSVS